MTYGNRARRIGGPLGYLVAFPYVGPDASGLSAFRRGSPQQVGLRAAQAIRQFQPQQPLNRWLRWIVYLVGFRR